MKKTKKHRFYHNWTFGKTLISILFILLIALLIANIIITKTFDIKNGRERNEFTNGDWEYMINYIESEYGNGKKFIVLKKETDEITKNKKTNLCVPENNSCYEKVYIGEEAHIIGNFEGEKKGYFVLFKRYVIDSPYKSGNNVIIHIYTNDNYMIDDYN